MAGALEGVRVLDLSRVLAGPYGSMLLADLGAEVIKIEQPGVGDETRTLGPRFLKGESAYFLAVNRNKKSLTLDLKAPAGREVFYDLVRCSDVVFDNFRPGVLERFGADYDTLKGINPRLISCSISGFGQTGPYRDLPAFDLIVQAMGGGMSITGEPGRPPVRMGLPIGDLAGGIFAAYGVVAALYQRERTGQGQRLDLSLLDCQVSLLTYIPQLYLFGGAVPGPVGSRHMSVVPYQAFQTKDGHIVVASYGSDKFWKMLCTAMGMAEMAEDSRYATNAGRLKHRQEVEAKLEGIFVTRGSQEWLHLLCEAGIPAGPINTIDQVLADPQVRAREMVVEMEHPRCGPIKVLGNPVKMSAAEKTAFAPPPALGGETEELLRGLLGYVPEKIERLRQEGII